MPKSAFNVNFKTIMNCQTQNQRHQIIQNKITALESNLHRDDASFELSVQSILNLQYIDAKLMLKHLKFNLLNHFLNYYAIDKQIDYHATMLRSQIHAQNLNQFMNNFKNYKTQITQIIPPALQKSFQTQFETNIFHSELAFKHRFYSFCSEIEFGNYTINTLITLSNKKIKTNLPDIPAKMDVQLIQNLALTDTILNLLLDVNQFVRNFNAEIDKWYRSVLNPDKNYEYENILKFRRQFKL